MSASKAYSAEEVAALGDELYETRIRERVEPAHRGKIVALDVRDGQYVIDETALAASEGLLAKDPSAEIWCVRVGHEALYHVGSRSLRKSA